MGKRLGELREELLEHIPFTVFSVAAGMAIVGFMTYAVAVVGGNAGRFELGGQMLFHVFHPLHVLFSAAATTAMFWRHERRWLKALVVGGVGALGICGISDIFLPHLSGLLLHAKMGGLHVCLIENPGLVVPFLLVGLFVGFILSPSSRKGTIYSHSAHVLTSSMASILYLVSFGLHDWIRVGGMVLVFMVLAVVLPCCVSDIVFPLLVTRPASLSDAAAEG